MWHATFLFPLYLKASRYSMLNITVGIFLILIANSETSPKGCFVSDFFILRSKLHCSQLAVGYYAGKTWPHVDIICRKLGRSEHVHRCTRCLTSSYIQCSWVRKPVNLLLWFKILNVKRFKWHWTARVSTACRLLVGASGVLWQLEDRQIVLEHVF